MVNIWAMIVSAIAAMVIGGIWWGPLFGKMWMKENGFNELSAERQEAMKKSMGLSYFQQFILSLIQAWALSYFLRGLGITMAGEGIRLAAILWAGFILPIQYGNKLWGGKSFKFVFAMLASSLLTVIVMGLIITLWR